MAICVIPHEQVETNHPAGPDTEERPGRGWSAVVTHAVDCQFREANVSILHEWLAERPLPHLPGPPTSGSAPLSDTPLLHDRNL